MNILTCDVAVIGAGTAGLAAYKSARDAGAKTLLIESGAGGTTCARFGCMPSKLLIAAADAAHVAATASVFGIQTAPVRIDGRAVMSRVRRERDGFVRGVLEAWDSIPDECRVQGTARFSDANTLAVDGLAEVKAKAVVIATGARPNVPKAFDAVRERVLTNETLFELPQLPSSIAVIGAGPLGIELGQALHRLGVRCFVFDKARAIGGLHGDAMNKLARELFHGSPNLRLGVDIEVARIAGGVNVTWQGASTGSADFEYLLVATGRSPNLDELELEATGLKLDEHGMPEFEPQTLQCGDQAIFIAGDADHDRPVLHEATREGEIAGLNAASYPQIKPFTRYVPMAIVFTDPQIAMIGDVKSTTDVQGSVDFSHQGRARVMNQNSGTLQIWADAESNILTGAQLIAPAAEHLAHLLAWAIQTEQTVGCLLDMPFYHPTLEEGLKTALQDLRETLAAGGAADVRSVKAARI